jgi:hypothetical protein
MSVGSVDSVVGTRNLPGYVRALSSLPEIDYADRFTLRTEVEATPEQWARAMFGDVPSVVELLIWRGLLGLQLSSGRSSATVAGWRIGDRGDDWLRLEAASWFLTGNFLVQTAAGRVSLGTFLRYDRRLGSCVWPPLSTIHRRLIPGVLRGGSGGGDYFPREQDDSVKWRQLPVAAAQRMWVRSTIERVPHVTGPRHRQAQ